MNSSKLTPFSKIEVSIRQKVLDNQHRLLSEWKHLNRLDPIALVDGVSVHLTEKLFYGFGSENKGKTTADKLGKAVSDKIVVLLNGKELTFDERGLVSTLDGRFCASPDDFFYTVDLPEHPARCSSAADVFSFMDLAHIYRQGRTFLRNSDWTIRNSPSVDLTSLSTFQNATGGLKWDWEYEHALETWARLQHFSGAQIMYRGGPPSQIARLAEKELKRISKPLPSKKDKQSFERYVQNAKSHYEQLTPEQKHVFCRKKLTVVFGVEGMNSDHSRLRAIWDDFVSEFPEKEQVMLRRSGPR